MNTRTIIYEPADHAGGEHWVLQRIGGGHYQIETVRVGTTRRQIVAALRDVPEIANSHLRFAAIRRALIRAGLVAHPRACDRRWLREHGGQ